MFFWKKKLNLKKLNSTLGLFFQPILDKALKNKKISGAVIAASLAGAALIYHFTATSYNYWPSYQVGTIDGKFAVTSNGAATYNIAIDVPPGTAGVAPQLSISYNSQGQDGYLGQGFSLGGISTIGRCSYIANYDDGSFERMPVTYSQSDHFCLDGEELILTSTSQPYGSDGAEYRTARETWTKVVSNGVCGSGPCSFTAYNKDGATLSFGTTTGSSGSQVMAGGNYSSSVRIWAMDQFTDLNGNFTQIIYQNNGSEYYPSQINYTGHQTNGKVDVNPRRSIKFFYQPKNDAATFYENGFPTLISERLSSIQTFVDSNNILTYNLNYEYSTPTGRSLLKSIQKCDAKNICLETDFGWMPSTDIYLANTGASFSINLINTEFSSSVKTFPADVNGDGNADMVEIQNSGGNIYITPYFSPGNIVRYGVFTQGNPTQTSIPVSNIEILPADVNGDGNADLIHISNNGGKLNLISYISKGNSGFSVSKPTNTGQGAGNIALLTSDVNGDGLSDVIHIYNTNGHVSLRSYLSVGDGTFIVGQPPSDSSTGAGNIAFYSGDVNGDGRADVIQTYSNNNQVSLISYLSNGDGTFSTQKPFDTGQTSKNVSLFIGEVNGDGKADIIQIWNNGQTYVISYFSQGDGSFIASNNGKPTSFALVSGTITYNSGDFNGDGRTDIVQGLIVKEHNVPFFYSNVITANADGSFNFIANNQQYKEVGMPPYPVSQGVADFNGDGKTDLTVIVPIQNNAYYQPEDDSFLVMIETASDPVPDFLTQINNGLGSQIAINYSPISGGSTTSSSTPKANYTRGNSANYPVVDLQTPMNVVTSYNVCDTSDATICDGKTSSSHQYIYQYQYNGAQYDLERGLWLGFKSFKTIDVANKRYSLVTYNQNYPQNGTIKQSEICTQSTVSGSASCSDGGGSLMSITSNSYSDHSLVSNLGIHQVLPDSALFSLYTLGKNQPMQTLGKKFYYDNYGNVSIVADLGNVDSNMNSINDPNNYPVYLCSFYYNNEDPWKLGYVLQEKQTLTLQACQNFLTQAANNNVGWDDVNDLTWTQRTYDDNGNEASQSIYNDDLSGFSRSYSNYDAYGNVIAVVDNTDAPMVNFGACDDNHLTQSCITYDEYNTFPIQVDSEYINNSKIRLTSWKAFEPGFGQLIYSTNPNGNGAGDESFTNYYDIDGFGRTINRYGPDNSGNKTLLATTTLNSGSQFSQLTSGFYSTQSFLPDWNESDQSKWYYEQDFYDGMGRKYLHSKAGINSSSGTAAMDPILAATNFSANGNVDGETLPYFKSSNSGVNALPSDWNMNCGSSTTPIDNTPNSLNWSKVNYDVYNRPICSTRPDGIQTQTSYSYVTSGALNLLQIQKTDAYNTNDNVSELTFVTAQQKVVQKTYSNHDNLYYKYDNLGRIIAITLTPYNSNTCNTATIKQGTTCFTYNSMGKMTSQASSDSGTTNFTYDLYGRLVSYKDADGNSESYAYDNLDRLIIKSYSETDLNNQTTDYLEEYTYDIAQGLINTKGALASIVKFTTQQNVVYSYFFNYDNSGHIVKKSSNLVVPGITLPIYLSYNKSYDPMGRLSSYVYPDGSIQQNTYGADANISNVALCDNSTSDCSVSSPSFVNYASYNGFNALGSITNVTYGSSPKGIINIVKNYYPSIGQTNGGNFVGGAYDPYQIIVSSVANPSQNYFAKQYNWNRVGEVVAINDLVTAANNESFSYNDEPGMGFLSTANGDFGNYKYSYDNYGNILASAGGSSTYAYSYNSNTNQLYSDGNGTTNIYYSNGDIKQKTQKLSNVTNVWNYAYDNRDKLIYANVTGKQNANISYIHDLFGDNISRLVSQDNGNLVYTYYAAPGFEIDYYGNSGSYQTAVNTKYVSGPDGVIAAVSSSGSVNTNYSNYQSNKKTSELLSARSDLKSKIKSIYYNPNKVKWLKIALIIFAMMALVFLLYNFVKKTKTKKTNRGRKHKIRAILIPFLVVSLFLSSLKPAYANLGPWTPGVNGAGYPVAGNIRFFIKDNLGNIEVITDENGNPTADLAYLPYGAIDQNNSLGTDDFRPKFSQNEYDSYNLMYNFGDRFYDPQIGRFVTPDPSRQYISPYVYTGDSPMSYVDGNGDFAFGLFIAIVIGALVSAYMGGVAVDHGNWNPAAWNWKSGMTYAGIFGGAIIGGAGGGFGAYATEQGIAYGLSAAILIGAGENAAFTSMGGGSWKDIGIAAAEGAAFGLAAELGGMALGKFMSNFARRGISQLARNTESIGNDIGEGASEACSSFQAGTEIITNKGSKPIETIKVGDIVLSYNEKENKNEFEKVTALRNRISDVIVKITLNGKGQEIRTTKEHPFYVKKENNYQWIKAKNLKIGDQLYSNDNNPRVTSIKNLPGDKVYNFEVAKNHNYYVSNNSVLVHNMFSTCGAGGSMLIGGKRVGKRLFVSESDRFKSIVDGEDLPKRVGKKPFRLGIGGDGIHEPGPYSSEDARILATGARVTKAQSAEMQDLGYKVGCHRCGVKDPGTDPFGVAKKFVGDHQRPTVLNFPFKPQYLYPHCPACSSLQGGLLAAGK